MICYSCFGLQKVLNTRVGNPSQRVGFVSTRLTRLHIRVQHEPDPIINRVEYPNPNTTLLLKELPEHDPGNPLCLVTSSSSSSQRCCSSSSVSVLYTCLSHTPSQRSTKKIIKEDPQQQNKSEEGDAEGDRSDWTWISSNF